VEWVSRGESILERVTDDWHSSQQVGGAAAPRRLTLVLGVNPWPG
jgi:hypothetical protein